MNRTWPLTSLLALGICAGCQPPSPTTPIDRDNTAVNQRDRDPNAKTPLDQSNKQSDVDVTASIRKALQGEDVSVAAKNIKIITAEGMVTLRGPVKTQAEKDIAERIAHEVAGKEKVDNQLEVEKQP